MIYIFIAQRCSDLPVAACCRVMRVSTSGFYDMAGQPGADRDREMRCSPTPSSTSSGWPALLRLASGSRRAAPRAGPPLLSQTGRAADAPGRRRGHLPAQRSWLHPTRPRRHSGRGSGQPPVHRRRPGPSVGHGRHRTPHRRGQGLSRRRVDAWSRRVVGWSIADHIRQELVVDAVQMAIWRRRRPKARPLRIPTTGRNTPAGRSDGVCGPPDCSAQWAASATPMTTRVRELLPHPAARTAGPAPLDTRHQLAQAIFEWIETWYNPTRRHSYCDMLSPVDYETMNAA